MSAKRTVLIISIIEVIAIIVIIVSDIFVGTVVPMTIMCPNLKNLTKNLGMILQALAHLQHLLFFLHMTPCDAGWRMEHHSGELGGLPWRFLAS